MDERGLLVVPEFKNPEKYLEDGEMTKITPEIYELTKCLTGENDEEILRSLIWLMNRKTRYTGSAQDKRKFRRTASEILKSRETTGCCDACTVFVTLARSKNIPSMQVITFNKEAALKSKGGPIISGHFFAACYVLDKNGDKKWILVDPSRKAHPVLGILDLDDRNINDEYYAFAYANDFRDVNVDGIKIDSSRNMAQVQQIAYDRANKGLIEYDSYEK